MKGTLIVLNGRGHETITENKRAEAMRLFEEGYRFWENHPEGADKIVLGEQVKPARIRADRNYVAMRQMAGG